MIAKVMPQRIFLAGTNVEGHGMTDDEERQERELERVWEFITPRLERAERAYSQALTRVC
jgi:hypothetical protein